MTKKEIIDGNLLIAEFTGQDKAHDPRDRIYHYDTSWDWLMPVVEKIESLGVGFAVERNKVSLHGFIPEIIEIYSWESSTVHDKMTYTFEGVVEFIKWYNKKRK